MKKKELENNDNNVRLINRTTVNVRFNEIDSLRIVWHGHFIKYFEDGREAFGKQFGFGYYDLYKQNLVTPIVDIHCQYKKHLAYGDEIIVETEFIDTSAAKIIFEYKIFKKNDLSLVATGKSIQVFLDTNGELILINPEFFLDWKTKCGLKKK